MTAPVVLTRKRGNPDWGRPHSFIPVLPTEFEKEVQRIHLAIEAYASSPQLKRWCELNCNRVYVPEWLLEEWGITVHIEFSPAA